MVSLTLAVVLIGVWWIGRLVQAVVVPERETMARAIERIL